MTAIRRTLLASLSTATALRVAAASSSPDGEIVAGTTHDLTTAPAARDPSALGWAALQPTTFAPLDNHLTPHGYS